MPNAKFTTTSGQEIEIDPGEVVHLAQGPDEDTTVIELDSGKKVTVEATELEVAGDLGLNPLDFVAPEDDDESIQDLVEGEGDDYDEEEEDE